MTSNEALTQSVATNVYGQYTLYYATSGTKVITETNLPFFVSTTPDLIEANAVAGSSGSSPEDFGDLLGIRVSGQVFNDINVNGVNDVEAGVAGAIVSSVGTSYATSSSGVYTLYISADDLGSFVIAESDPLGYVSTNAVPGNGLVRVDANTLSITNLISGSVYLDNDFGDVAAINAITVSGQVWNDNGLCAGCLANGVRDAGEPGLAGALVSASTGLSQTTSSTGNFLLYAPPGQIITVSETNPDSYVSTQAIPGNDAVKYDNDTIIVDSLPGNSTSSNNRFGDVLGSDVAVITGTVFADTLTNGQMDAGETGLPGVLVSLEIEDGNVITIPTDSFGRYQFAVAPGTNVRIVSSGPGGGYYPTTPESIFVRPTTSGLFPNVNFGYNDDSSIGVIYGQVFDDINSDGQVDFGELGLSGAVISLTLDSNIIGSVTTTSNGLIAGTFVFTTSQAGTHALFELNPPGYRSTTPDNLNVQVALGSSHYVDFGDTNSVSYATVYGTAFDDVDGNGSQDASEVGLPGVLISVTIGTEPYVLTTTSKTYGQYTYGFDLTEQGYHAVSEEDPALPGYRSTTPDEINIYTVANHSYIINFGDVSSTAEFATIMGIVFDDVSDEGVRDISELGIPNVLISLSNGVTTTTGLNGAYSLVVGNMGHTKITEIDPNGYHSTTPNEVTVPVTDWNTYQVDFGDSSNIYVSSFFGTVFRDDNVNGIRDATEIGLSGVTVAITDTFVGLPAPYVTNQWGQFTFPIENTGVYTVSENDPTGYISTNAIPGHPAVLKVDNNTFRVLGDQPGRRFWRQPVRRF